MERERLIEMNKKYGNTLMFQQLLRDALKKDFKAEIIKLQQEEKGKRAQNG